mgnify:CR=1 FL=1
MGIYRSWTLCESLFLFLCVAVSSNANSNLPSKIPGGLVTKGNSTLGYEKVRVGGSGQAPFPFPAAGMFGGMPGIGGMGAMGFFPGMAGMPQHNAAQLFQQSKYRCLDG